MSLQCSSTSPVPSAMEAMTWTLWACPSEETSGSSASRCTPPPATPPSQRWWTSSWRKSASRDRPSPSRCHSEVNLTFCPLWFPLGVLMNMAGFPLCSSDANRPAVLSVLTAGAKRFWQGTVSKPLNRRTSFKWLLHKIIYPQLALLQACGVDFEIKAYLANAALNPDEVIEKKYGIPVAEALSQTQINAGLKKSVFFFHSFFLLGIRAAWWFAKYSLRQPTTKRDLRRK